MEDRIDKDKTNLQGFFHTLAITEEVVWALMFGAIVITASIVFGGRSS